jgi:hypothetical protein
MDNRQIGRQFSELKFESIVLTEKGSVTSLFVDVPLTAPVTQL